jgi:hypothetical protein
LLPLEFCQGTRPSQAAKSGPQEKADGSGTLDTVSEGIRTAALPIPAEVSVYWVAMGVATSVGVGLFFG